MDFLSLLRHEIDFSFSRSSGPGGQNVNKVSSKATLKWNVEASSALPWKVRRRFLLKFGRRLTVEGVLVLQSDRFRDQKRNKEDCLEKLEKMLRSVEKPSPRRIKTKVPRKAIEERLESKRRRSETKLGRKRDEG